MTKIIAQSITVDTGPSVEPVTAAEAKLHLRIDHADEDALITRIIEVARRHCEQVSRRAFITQTLSAALAAWPADDRIELPYLPLQSVTSLTYVDKDGNTDTVSTDVYDVDTRRGIIYLAQDQVWPGESMRSYDPITITWVAGFGDAASDVPEGYKQAMMLLMGHLYENREAVIAQQGMTITTLPMALDALLMVDRAY